jgi:hypothetical protein
MCMSLPRAMENGACAELLGARATAPQLRGLYFSAESMSALANPRASAGMLCAVDTAAVATR